MTVHICLEVDVKCSVFLLRFGAGALTDTGVPQFSEAGWPSNSKVLPVWESPALECILPHPALHMNSGDLNLGPDAYVVSTLPADPSQKQAAHTMMIPSRKEMTEKMQGRIPHTTCFYSLQLQLFR